MKSYTYKLSLTFRKTKECIQIRDLIQKFKTQCPPNNQQMSTKMSSLMEVIRLETTLQNWLQTSYQIEDQVKFQTESIKMQISKK
jgi:hypothetical protein